MHRMVDFDDDNKEFSEDAAGPSEDALLEEDFSEDEDEDELGEGDAQDEKDWE